MRYEDYLPDLVELYKPKNSYQKKVLLEGFKAFCRDQIGQKTARIAQIYEQIALSPRSIRRTWGTLQVLPFSKRVPFRQFRTEGERFWLKHLKLLCQFIKGAA